ncbi:MAG: ATP-binding cassette domain-containing protein [Clostridiales bacterium]|nr:ATP-binding cassette domain-containing protein [Clostridiales bacterium]
MSIAIDIRKKLGDFFLDIAFDSDAKRIGILGPSGCGKSMTLKSIAGIEKPDGGRILIDDRVLFDHGQKINLKPQKRRVGYMFQNYALFPTMTVAQNIGAGLGLSNEERNTRVAEMIERFHLHGLEKHLPGQLSGGQQQRVALARIMAYRPDIILLDEPFSALDEHLKERLQHEMMTMLEDYEGQVILVSHSRDEIYRFSEELLIMDSGHVMARGKTAQLFDDPGTVAVARMTGCKNFSAAERLDAHHIKLKDWGITLELVQDIPEDIHAVGYRAHAFEPIWGERQKNCLAFHLSGVDELPFERRYYLLPEDSDSRTEDSGAGGSLRKDPSELICWFIQDRERVQMDGKPTPDYLRLREESIMLLRK